MGKEQAIQTKLLQAYAWLFHYGLALSMVFEIWYSLDHAGRVAPRSLSTPTYYTVYFFIALGMRIASGWKPDFQQTNSRRLTVTTICFSIILVMLVVYRYAFDTLLMRDGLIDARILAGGALFICSIFAHQKPKPSPVAP